MKRFFRKRFEHLRNAGINLFRRTQLMLFDPIRAEKSRPSLHKLLMLYVLAVLLFSGALALFLVELLFFLGMMPAIFLSGFGHPFITVLVFIFISVLISDFLSASKVRTADALIRGMEKISQGDFTVRLDEDSSDKQMRSLTRSFNNMASELDGIELFKKDFINNFSHEFKTPIVSIRGFAKQLQRDDLTEAQRREYTDIILAESERLAQMSGNVLLLTKLENQQYITECRRYSLDEQIRKCILLLEKQWTDKELELNLTLNEADYFGNEEMISHIWINLLSNAIKFSAQGGLLEVGCSRDAHGVHAYVRDHGEGMSEETKAHIFEKFYQGDSAHATQGNGLGLSLVRRIVDLHRGSIHVESVPGEGTTFFLFLPDA